MVVSSSAVVFSSSVVTSVFSASVEDLDSSDSLLSEDSLLSSFDLSSETSPSSASASSSGASAASFASSDELSVSVSCNSAAVDTDPGILVPSIDTLNVSAIAFARLFFLIILHSSHNNLCVTYTAPLPHQSEQFAVTSCTLVIIIRKNIWIF